MKRIVILTVIIVVLTALGYAYYEFNRGNAHLKNEQADYLLDAVAFMDFFEKDLDSANRQFIDKIVAVTGKISKVNNAQGTFFIFFQNPSGTASVKCSMDSVYSVDYKNLKVNNTVTVKGICVGGELLDFGLGTDVSMKRCVIEIL